MLRWFEKHIDPFAKGSETLPPGGLLAFYWHYIKPVWHVFVLLMIVGFISSIIEVSLFAFIGGLVDRMRLAPDPLTFFQDHWLLLTWMAVVAALLRPLAFIIADLVKNQTIAAPFTNRVRWQTHRWVLRQSLGYFQNDFAGRIANKIMQTGAALRESVVQCIESSCVRSGPSETILQDL